MTIKQKTLVLLDGNALVHRSYHALPPMTTKTGESVNAVYGFALTLFGVLEKFKPDYIAASFDLPGGTFRDDLYKEYKAQRVAAPDDLYVQIPRVKALVQAMNIPIYEMEGYEADDCVGTLARQGEKEGVEVVIVTGDTDTLQLVTDHVKVFTLRKGLKDMVLLGPKEVEEKYGFPPERLIDYKGLRGDSSDNIPGVKGVGEKTATDLIQEFGSLEDIYQNLEKVKPKVREKLEADKEMAFLSKKLGTIDTAAPVTLDLAATITHDFDRETIETFLRELEFFSLLKRIPGGENRESLSDRQARGIRNQESNQKKKSKNNQTRISTEKELRDFLESVRGKLVAVMIKEKESSLFGTGMEAVGLASALEGRVVEWNEATELVLRSYLADTNQPKLVYDWKAMEHVLAKEKTVLQGVTEDLLLSAYVLGTSGKFDLETLFETYVGRSLASGTLEDNMLALHSIYQALKSSLEAVASQQSAGKTVLTILHDLELPLVSVLFQMEQKGILIERSVFATLSKEIEAKLKTAEKEIFILAGKEFNLNSPKQLAEVLFVDLAIPTGNIKKNKTGFSTASTELEKLREAYPIIALIEEYRELFKLKTTYVDVLPGMVAEDERLHTRYDQAVAATGRLSSNDPNLQNIPIRTEWGHRMRQGFVAAPGKKLVGADYSQIELRIAAHLSGDETMIKAFQNNEDIHRTTAALVHGIHPEHVTDSMRREAKVLNFGIIYGMGAFGLAQAAKIDQKAASEFIKGYLKKFSGVAKYMEDMKKHVHEHGFVETELGRRRLLPEIKSGNVALVRAAERMAINMPIQGLAADIVKLAMLDSRALLEKYTGRAALLLQIHDELIFEVDEAIAEEFGQALKKVMESAYRLKVPLLVSVEIGNTWGEI